MIDLIQFENYVNYAGSKTDWYSRLEELQFENYVNYAGSKTVRSYLLEIIRLRTM